jgi:hypothetical protein
METSLFSASLAFVTETISCHATRVKLEPPPVLRTSKPPSVMKTYTHHPYAFMKYICRYLEDRHGEAKGRGN